MASHVNLAECKWNIGLYQHVFFLHSRGVILLPEIFFCLGLCVAKDLTSHHQNQIFPLFVSFVGFHSADALVSKTVGEQLARSKTLAMKGTSSQDA